MKSILQGPLAALAFVFLMPVQGAAAADNSRVTTTDILLVQQAKVVVPRDRITATLRVTLKGPSARQIQIDINRKMIAALGKVKNSPAVTAETGSYSVNRTYNNQGGEGNDWRGEQSLTLTSGDFDAVLNLAGDLQNDGLIMGEMRFFVSPDALKAVQDELTATALKAMEDRAANIAGDLHLKVDRYKTITVGNAAENFGETPVSSKGTVSGPNRKAPPPAAIAGEALVTLTVNSTVLMSP
jgi:predicted secreted protein